jgi:hypothetical protein
MPTFDFLPLLWWGLPLAAAPIIIHLINLLRHRKVPWAAMEFLLASQRKYRTRVLLKQWLLLLLRVAAVLGIVLALAQPRWRSAIGQLLGGSRSAHVVLLDDSYSMSDLSTGGGLVGDTSAFDRGKLVVERIAAELAGAQGMQEIAVGRFSLLQTATASGTAAARFDIARQTVTPQLVQQVRDELAPLVPSATACGPRAAVQAAAEAVGAGVGATNVVWLVSDFRARDWKTADETAALLRKLSDAGVELRLVDCAAGRSAGDGLAGADSAAAARNLSIERLEVVGGVPATGVLVPLEATVHNDSDRPVRDVQVELREDGGSRPGLRLPEIPAGGSVRQRFEARFTKPGSHVVDARIQPDAVAADNSRTAVIDVLDRIDVLLIDGALGGGKVAVGDGPRASSRAGDAFYLATALAPGSGAPTGLRPRIESPRSLATLDLGSFDCVWLLDVEQLDAQEVAPLEAFARGGGGVVFFTGPRTDAERVNRTLHRGGDGLFPVPLAGPVDLLEDPAKVGAPDVVVEEHPVVAVLSGQRNPLLDAVRVDRFMAVQRGYEPPAGSGLRRLLSLRNGAPLVVERTFGDGLVVAVLTTASPAWNNWARGNPSWVVVMLELESHLARVRRRAESLEVGEPLTVRLEPGVDEVDVDFVMPPDGVIVHQTAAESPAGLQATLASTSATGPYSARWRRFDGTERERVFAVNVEPDEGRLERIGRERLDRTLSGVIFKYDKAETLQPDSSSLAGVSLVTPLLHALLALLVVEQIVAYSASYHAAARPARPA